MPLTHPDLCGLAAGAARHAWYVAVQPGLELEEVQVAPRARKAVMHRLSTGTTSRAGQPRALAVDLEIDAPLGGVELDVLNHPGRLQAQCTGEQGFNANAHDNPQLDPPRGHVDSPASDLPTCPPGSTTTIDSDCWVPHEMTRGRLGSRLLTGAVCLMGLVDRHIAFNIDQSAVLKNQLSISTQICLCREYFSVALAYSLSA